MPVVASARAAAANACRMVGWLGLSSSALRAVPLRQASVRKPLDSSGKLERKTRETSSIGAPRQAGDGEAELAARVGGRHHTVDVAALGRRPAVVVPAQPVVAAPLALGALGV